MLRRHAQRLSRGVGSGFVVDPKGLILTNYHVVENMSRIMVKLSTGETVRGQHAFSLPLGEKTRSAK